MQSFRQRIVQVPNEAVHSGFGGEWYFVMDPVHGDGYFVRIGFRRLIIAREAADQRAFGVIDFKLHRRFGLLLEVVVQDGGGRIFCERLVERDGRALIAARAHANRSLRMEEPGARGSDLRVDLAQRRNVIQNPKGAAVRGDRQIVVMHDEVADRSSGHIELQRLPGIAVIERDVHAHFRASVEQAFAYRIFADAIEEAAFGNAGGGALPGFAEVTRTVEIRLRVFEAVTVDRGVRDGSVEMRRFDVRDFAPGREFRRSDVAPGLAFVLRELDQPVVGAGPNFTGLDGGRCDGVNDAAALPFRRVRRGRGIEI